MAAVVRTARPGEARALAEVHVRSWQACYRGLMPDDVLDNLSIDQREQWWAEELTRPQSTDGAFVSELEGSIVGIAACGPARGNHAIEGAGELGLIYLLPEWWGKGLGLPLLEASTTRMQERGYAQAMLWVITANDRARRFYEAHGWRFDGFEKMYRVGEHEIPEVRYVRDL